MTNTPEGSSRIPEQDRYEYGAEKLALEAERLRENWLDQLLENAVYHAEREGDEVYLLTKLQSKKRGQEYQGVTKITWLEDGIDDPSPVIDIEFRQVQASRNETLENYPIELSFSFDEPSSQLSEKFHNIFSRDLALMAAMSNPDNAKLIGRERYEDFV